MDEIECDFLNAEHIGQLAVLIYAPSHPEAITETARISARININDALAATEEELDKIIEKAIQEMRNVSMMKMW